MISTLTSGKEPVANLFSFSLAFYSLSQWLSTSCIHSFSIHTFFLSYVLLVRHFVFNLCFFEIQVRFFLSKTLFTIAISMAYLLQQYL